MSLIDKKKDSTTDVLIKIKFFLINISISLAVYILIFTIGSITMFTCNISKAELFNKQCPPPTDQQTNIEVPINFISNNDIIDKYFDYYSTVTHRPNTVTHRPDKIFQTLRSDNTNNLVFCIDDTSNDFFGIFINTYKETMNFIYNMINQYAIFLNKNMSEIIILWISPLFSFLLFSVLVFISSFYFFFKMIHNSGINIWKNIWELKILKIMISFGWMLLTIFGFVISPIITFCLVLYSIFNILTQTFTKKNVSAEHEHQDEYKLFEKFVDNLNYQKGYNIIIILIICIINVFAFDASIGGVIFALIVIFYVIFYKKLNLPNISSYDWFFHIEYINKHPPTKRIARDVDYSPIDPPIHSPIHQQVRWRKPSGNTF